MKLRTRKAKRFTTNAKKPRRKPVLALDPTRTTTLRQAFAKKIRKKFRILKAAIYKLVVLDDAFGLVDRNKAGARNAEETVTLYRGMSQSKYRRWRVTGKYASAEGTARSGANDATTDLETAKHYATEKMHGDEGVVVKFSVPVSSVEKSDYENDYRVTKQISTKDSEVVHGTPWKDHDPRWNAVEDWQKEEAGIGGGDSYFSECERDEHGWCMAKNQVGTRNQEYASTQLIVTDAAILQEVKRLQAAIDPVNVVKLDRDTHITVRYGLHENDWTRDKVERLVKGFGGVSAQLGKLSLFQLPDKDVLKFDVLSGDLYELYNDLKLVPNTETHEGYFPHMTVAYLRPGTGAKYLRDTPIDGAALAFDRLMFSDVDRNLTPLSLNAPNQFKFDSTPEQLAKFQEWLREQFAGTLTGKSDEELWRRYAEEGFRKGAARAFDDIRAAPQSAKLKDAGLDFADDDKKMMLRNWFGRPETKEKLQIMASRSFDDLKNVTGDMATRMGRTLTDGLSQGMNPRAIAKELDDDLEIGRNRAEVIARTEIIRAHAEGQLDSFDRMGVEEVGVMVEFSTAGDDRVCDACQPMEGAVFRVEEAHNMIPVHPQCRCSFIPANVGEDTAGQTRGKDDLYSAIRESREASGRTAKDWGPDVRISKDRPESILGVIKNAELLEFSRALNGVAE